MKHSSFITTISLLDVETSALIAATSVTDSRVGITPQMCNIITNHGEMGFFPDLTQPITKFVAQLQNQLTVTQFIESLKNLVPRPFLYIGIKGYILAIVGQFGENIGENFLHLFNLYCNFVEVRVNTNVVISENLVVVH